MIDTTLDGALRRHPDGWHWADGTPEPAVRDMHLSDLAPNFRVIATGPSRYVEVPASWRSRRWWPTGQVDPDVVREITALVARARPAQVYADGLAEIADHHRASVSGYLVPVEQWDAAMIDVIGVWWASEDEARILATAQSMAGQSSR